jgi:hypothetical protein
LIQRKAAAGGNPEVTPTLAIGPFFGNL